MEKKSKKTKIIIIVVAVVLVLALIGFFTQQNENEPDTTAGSESVTQTNEITTDPPRDNSIGKSYEDVLDLFGSTTPNSMRNDATGNWKVITLSKAVSNLAEYAVSYYVRFMDKTASNEVHWVVNFANNTTTSIKYIGDVIYVDTHEYVDGEEHDAKEIGGGQLLTSYLVYLDNGDIVKAE